MRRLLIAAFVPAIALARVHGQSQEASYLNLPAGADETIGRPIDVGFSCSDREFGYYADMNNDCKVFHLCHPTELPDGQRAVLQYSFMCPATSTFDQQTMTCVFEPSVECGSSDRFYDLNERFGAKTNFHSQPARANANGMQRYAPTAPVPAPAPAMMPYAPSASVAGGAPLAVRVVPYTPNNAAVPGYFVPAPASPAAHAFYGQNAPNFQHQTSNSQHPTSNSQHPASNSQHPASNFQHPASNSQHPASNSQHPASNSQRPASNSQRPTSNSQRPTSNSQHPARNSQPAHQRPHLPYNRPHFPAPVFYPVSVHGQNNVIRSG